MYGGLMILCLAFGPSFFKDSSFSICPYTEFFVSVSFYYSCLFFDMTSFFPIILWSNSDRPRRTRLLCFPFRHQSNFIKLFDGGLQYKVIWTFFKTIIISSFLNPPSARIFYLRKQISDLL